MIINVEFLCDEPVENIITSLNFKVDKTIFFGSAEMIEKWKIPEIIKSFSMSQVVRDCR